MIEIKNVTKSYVAKNGTVHAVSNINLTVAPGEICGVIGKSGAGKSTLIRCVNLLERPTEGRVLIAGQDLTAMSAKELRAARHKIGMVFQHFNLLNTRTVYENIAFPLELLGYTSQEIEKTVTPLIELTELTTRKNAYPSQLSGGQKQRVAIARALATKPKVLLCDEMTSALDPQTTESILQLVRSIHKELQLSTLLITHEMEVIKMIADRVVVLDEGRVVENTDVLSLFKNPQSEVARKLVQSTLKPLLPPHLQAAMQLEPMPGGFTIVKLFFAGKLVGEPIIHDLIRQHAVSVDIILANVEYLCNETIGTMVLSLDGSVETIQQSIRFLQSKDLNVEVLGYVRANDWSLS